MQSVMAIQADLTSASCRGLAAIIVELDVIRQK